MNVHHVLAFTAAAMIVAACSPSERTVDPPPPLMQITADEPTLPLALALAAAYEDHSVDTVIATRQGHRQSVLDSITNGQADAGIVFGVIDGRTVFHTPIAREMLIIATHKSVPIRALSTSEARDVFSGDTTFWEDSDDMGFPVQAITYPEGYSVRLAFDDMIMAPDAVTKSARLVLNNDMAAHIAATPGGVGYLPHSQLTDGISAVTFEGIQPALEEANRYPLIALIEFVTVEAPQGEVKAFLDWILSDEGQTEAETLVLRLNE